jgi:hypothetical protein
LAAKHNFTAGTVPLVDPIDLTATDPVTRIAKYEISEAYDGYGQQRINFVNAVFDESLQKYESRRIPGRVAGTDFIFWKTDEVAPKMPTFEECSKQVEQFVKLQKAAKLARDAAKKEADAARQSGKSLSEFCAGQSNKKVIESGLFSWISVDFQGRLQRGQVPGIEYAGDDFMRDVFSLKEGEYGTALDNPKKTAYLVYMKSDLTDPESLRLAYARTGPTLDLIQLQRIDSAMRLEEWYRDFQKTQNLTWVRPPRSGR